VVYVFGVMSSAPLVVSCLGDSNTESSEAGTCWVDQVRATLPRDRFTLINRGQGGATALEVGSSPNAWVQLEGALAEDQPDLVILSFGTNDISVILNVSPTPKRDSVLRVVKAYVSLAGLIERAGARAAVALTPPFNPAVRNADTRATLVRWLNDALRETFPPELLLDFYAVADAHEDLNHAFHLTETGHARRAALVSEWLCGLRLGSRGQLELPTVSHSDPVRRWLAHRRAASGAFPARRYSRLHRLAETTARAKAAKRA
jgi:lysophospholipase L1-like esterase